MNEDYRKAQDHHDSLYLLKEGLEDASALKVFLEALAKAIQELDDDDTDSSQQTRFLTDLDKYLGKAHRTVGSGPRVVLATTTFRTVLDQHLAEMLTARQPRQ